MPEWKIKVFYDAGCPACNAEMRMLRRWDKQRGRISFEDITDPDWDPTQYNITLDQAMGAMHAILPDGSIVIGVEAFRHAYTALGRGWLIAWTTLPVIRQLADFAYLVFARHRHRIARAGCAEWCKPRV